MDLEKKMHQKCCIFLLEFIFGFVPSYKLQNTVTDVRGLLGGMPIGILEKEELNWSKGSDGREEVGEERRKLSKNRTVNTSRNNVFLQL